MATSSNSIPVVFQQFDIPENVQGTFKAKCRHCASMISGSTKATSNFLLHLKVNTLPYYLSVPASSAPVERLFSIAGKVFRPERCRLTDKNFETLMFIRSNFDV